ncbi:MAG: DUF2304 family protein [Solirubrobacterales bacterium]
MRRLFLLLTVLALAGPAAAWGETLEVTSESETGTGSLGTTILEAGPGDTIRIPPGTYPLTNGDTLVEQGNRLEGAGEDLTTIVPTGGGEALDQVTVSGVTVGPAENPESDDDSGLETKVQIVALLGTLALFILVLDLVRRRRLAERYALLWMSASAALLVLAIWRGGLEAIADLMGIAEPANAIFILAFGVAFLLLLNFSVVTTRLSEETKILAQESARLEQELRAARGEMPSGNGASAPPAAEQREHDRPVGAQDEP